MSQALIDLDISHEEFKTIVNEKEKYEQMKESIRNTKSRDEIDELNQNSLAVKVTMDCRTTTAVDFKTRLGFS